VERQISYCNEKFPSNIKRTILKEGEAGIDLKRKLSSKKNFLFLQLREARVGNNQRPEIRGKGKGLRQALSRDKVTALLERFFKGTLAWRIQS